MLLADWPWLRVPPSPPWFSHLLEEPTGLRERKRDFVLPVYSVAQGMGWGWGAGEEGSEV